jgi:hypothetical protein
VSDAAAPLPCAGSAHLALLVDEVDRLARRVAGAAGSAGAGTVSERRAVEDAASAEATLRLDGGLHATPDGRTERQGTWLDALGGTAVTDGADAIDRADGTDEATLARLAVLERAGVAAGIAADDLAAAFGRANADAGGLGTALAALHGRITTGLVAEERAGRLRRGPRVVHDASVGRVLFFPTDPALLPDAWDQLLRHVTGSGAGAKAARLAPAVRAALLQFELVRHQPFDAANGRVARAATRLALLADGLLPGGLGAPDAVLAEDTLGYHEQVGASIRRRDATRWVERALEAHGSALRRSLDALGAADADVASDVAPPAGLDATFTLGEVRALLGGTSAAAMEVCSAWVVAGHAERTIGTSGLRFRLRTVAGAAAGAEPAADAAAVAAD